MKEDNAGFVYVFALDVYVIHIERRFLHEREINFFISF